jgi:hypothetical protein
MQRSRSQHLSLSFPFDLPDLHIGSEGARSCCLHRTRKAQVKTFRVDLECKISNKEPVLYYLTRTPRSCAELRGLIKITGQAKALSTGLAMGEVKSEVEKTIRALEG